MLAVLLGLGLLGAAAGTSMVLLRGHQLLHREVERIGPVPPYTSAAAEREEYGGWWHPAGSGVTSTYWRKTEPVADDKAFLPRIDEHLAAHGYRPVGEWECGTEHPDVLERSCERMYSGRFNVLVGLDRWIGLDPAHKRRQPELELYLWR